MKKNFLFLMIALLAVAGFLFVNASTARAADVVKMRFATASFPGLPTHAAAVKFAELIQKNTNGRYLIEPIQERKLGQDLDNIELVGAGAVEMAHVSTAVFDSYMPDLNALQMPFLIRSYEHLEKVYLADATAKLLKAIEKQNLVPLGLIENGYRHIGNNIKSINVPEDLKGITLRVAETKLHQKILTNFGAIPIPISYGEIYTSLKTGVINGTEINATSASSEKLMEVIKFFSLTGHFFWPSVGFVNKGIWDKMPPADQKIFIDTWKEMIPWQIALCKSQDEKALETMKAKGIKINEADSKAFLERSKPIYDEYMKVPAIAGFVEAVRALQ